MDQLSEHPSFTKAKALTDGALQAHFPKSVEEAKVWRPLIIHKALAMRVLVVAQTRVECAWAAYVDAVPGMNHASELHRVLSDGDKLDESIARALFPMFNEVPYAW